MLSAGMSHKQKFPYPKSDPEGVAVVQAAGLADKLSSVNFVGTVLIPTDAAFMAAAQEYGFSASSLSANLPQVEKARPQSVVVCDDPITACRSRHGM